MITQDKARRTEAGLLVVLVIYGMTAIGYAWLNPVFESPDEPSHVANVNLLLREHRWPGRSEIEATVAYVEAHANPALHYQIFDACQSAIFLLWPHPPLYYLLQTVPLAVVYPEGYDGVLVHARRDLHHRPERGYFQHHRPDLRDLSPPILAVRLMRMLSICLGGLVIWMTAQIARLAMPGAAHLPVLAAGIYAFIPQFTFMSASVNNDVLGYLASSFTLWLMLRLIHHPRSAARSAVTLGLGLGLGALSKWTTLFLWPLTVLVACLAYRRWTDRSVCAGGALAIGCAITWPFMADRLGLFADLIGLVVTGHSTFVPLSMGIFGMPPEASFGYVGRVLGVLGESFWVKFGWGQFPADRTVLTLYWLMVAGACAGWLWPGAAGRVTVPMRRRAMLILGGAIVSFFGFAGLIYGRIFIPQGGRYVLVIGSALMPFLAMGLVKLHGRLAHRMARPASGQGLLWFVLGGMASLNWFVLWRSIHHAYAVAWQVG